MTIVLHLHDGAERTISEHGNQAGVARGECPECKVAPFMVAGTGITIEKDRHYVAQGFCLGCKAHVGKIVASPSTLFGISEDRAVLHGRPRVY